MIRSIIFALALAAALSSAAQAQAIPQVIATCGVGVSLPIGPGGRLFVDQTGILCASGGGGSGGSSGSVTAAGTNGTVAQAVQGIVGGIPQNSYPGQFNTTLPTLASGATGYLAVDSNGRLIQSPGASVTVTTLPTGSQTTSGALQPPTAASGKITQTNVTLAATTSTTLIAANANRIAVEIQCDGTAPVGISRTGAALTDPTAAPLVIPSGSYPLYTMPIATLTAITAYTATAQVCRVTEYLR